MFSARRFRHAPAVRLLSWLIFAVMLFSLPTIASAGENIRSEGSILYSRHCASCHDSLEKNLLPNRSAARIRSAIRHIPAMSRLWDLKDSELEAIASVLVAPGAAED